MSGGSYEYAYRRVEDMAGEIRDRNPSALRRAFAAHLDLVAKAMHDVEWVDSCDYGKGAEEAAIRAVLGTATEALVLSEIRDEARRIMDELAKWTVTP